MFRSFSFQWKNQKTKTGRCSNALHGGRSAFIGRYHWHGLAAKMRIALPNALRCIRSIGQQIVQCHTHHCANLPAFCRKSTKDFGIGCCPTQGLLGRTKLPTAVVAERPVYRHAAQCHTVSGRKSLQKRDKRSFRFFPARQPPSGLPPHKCLRVGRESSDCSRRGHVYIVPNLECNDYNARCTCCTVPATISP